jgi:tripartite-type tricarboxylate transporter receptor subunit TctC
MLRSVSNTLLAIVLATTSLANAQTNAQTSAPKPIRLICPFPPAGAVDIASRAIATELAKFLGTTVTVENRPGAGGNIGGVEAVRSAPDGNTLFMTTSGINAINPALYAKMPFDPIKELAPVVALVSLSNVLVVHPSVKANSVADIIAMARAEPGKMNYASSGSGTSIHMSGEMFKHLAKVDVVHIP